MARSMSAFENGSHERLLRALAEQLKAPLLHIARESELARLTGATADLRAIEYTADMSLRLIDSYLLSVQLQAMPTLELEPVSLSAVLQDAAHRLGLLARQYDCDLDIHLSGKYEPVMAHRRSLEAAYMSLGYAFIEATPPSERRHRVLMAAHRGGNGLVAGVFGNQPELTADMYRRSKALYGHAAQTLPVMSGSNGAGVFIADSLLKTMAASLRVARHHKLSGLAATLLPSQQLQLVS
jgi:hypothetical protein